MELSVKMQDRREVFYPRVEDGRLPMERFLDSQTIES